MLIDPNISFLIVQVWIQMYWFMKRQWKMIWKTKPDWKCIQLRHRLLQWGKRWKQNSYCSRISARGMQKFQGSATNSPQMLALHLTTCRLVAVVLNRSFFNIIPVHFWFCVKEYYFEAETGFRIRLLRCYVSLYCYTQMCIRDRSYTDWFSLYGHKKTFHDHFIVCCL